MKAPVLLQSAGATAIFLFPVYAPAFAHPAWFRMHSHVPLRYFGLGLVFNIVALTLLFFFLSLSLDKTWLGRLLRLSLPGALAAGLFENIYIGLRGVPTRFVWPFLIFLTITCLLLVSRLVWQHGARIILRLCGAGFMGAGIFSMIVVVQLVHLSLWQPLPSYGALAPLRAESGHHNRVVWIVFDELSYDQVFEHRFDKLALPNFEKLREISTVFSNVRPAAIVTELAIPSMFLGRALDRVYVTNGDRFLVAAPGEPLRPFEAGETPFALATSHGMTTSVVGWYNPYCSILSPYLNQCYWTYDPLSPAVFIEGDRFWQNVKDTWDRYRIVLHPAREERSLDYQVRTYQSLMTRADGALAQNRLDFIFIHLPLPHPAGFYDRETGRFDTSGTRSYIDNLALTDKALGQLLSDLEQSPRWQDTSVLVCGDHSWRTFVWRLGRHWTTEDQVASRGGIYDPRPFLLVHVASQTKPTIVTQPFALISVHGILDSLILGQKLLGQKRSKPLYGGDTP